MLLNKKKISKFVLFFIIFFVHQFIFQKFFPNNKELLGHDYEYFLPNFMFGKIWFANNLLSIPYTQENPSRLAVRFQDLLVIIYFFALVDFLWIFE